MSDSKITIAIAHSYVDENVRTNCQNIRGQMTRAANAGCRLIQFTEAVVSGRFNEHIKHWKDVDQDLLRSEMEKIAAHADDLNIWVVIGCNHHLTPPHLPYDSLYIISDSGELVNRYDKRFISYNNIVSKKHTPGKIPITFEVDGIKFGCASGMDMCFNEVFEEYNDLLVDCVLYSVYGGQAPIYQITAQAQAGQNSF